jgi:hypothetical protein
MFEDLKQQRLRGMSPKERTRLVATVSLALVLGTVIFSARSCAGEPVPTSSSAPPREKREPARRSIDRAPFDALRASGGAAADLDGAALDSVLQQVRTGNVDLATRDPKTPAQVNALDPKEAVGTPVEVRGRVASLDWEPRDGFAVDALWSFALEGEGTQVAVLHGGSTNDPERGRPADAYRAGGITAARLAGGDLVIVRGVYLQRKTQGIVGRISLGGPTAVVVGSEYRRIPSLEPAPAPESLSAIDWGEVRDRVERELEDVEDLAHFQTLAWARRKGRERIVADLRSGALPVRVYDRDAYRIWHAEHESDLETGAPDPRRWTTEARGKVFVITGHFAYFDEESWATVEPNAYGVHDRWSFWVESDFHHRFGVLRLFSPFPLKEFPGIEGRRGERVKATAVFVKNWSYHPSGDRVEEQPVVAPYFVLLDLEPFVPYRSSPFYQNVFWYAGIALFVFGVLFYVVLIRGERKESASIERHRIAIRQRMRARETARGVAPSASVATPETAPPDEPETPRT